MVWSFYPQTILYGQPLDPVWRRAGHERGMEAPDYEVGALFEALDEEGVFAAAMKSTGHFFPKKILCE